MKTISKIKYVVLLVVTVMAFSCSPEDGAVGPAGPQGEQGIQGEQGPQGAQGEPGQDGQDGANGTNGQDGADGQDGTNGQDGADGEDGNANVVASGWIQAQWNYRDFDSFKAMRISLAEIGLTNTVFRNTIVLGYYQFNVNISNSMRAIYPLPGSGQYPDDVLMIDFTYGESGVGEDGIKFWMRRLDGQNLDASQSSTSSNYFKYIIISPSSMTGKSSKTSILEELKTAGVDISNYHTVCDYYGLAY